MGTRVNRSEFEFCSLIGPSEIMAVANNVTSSVRLIIMVIHTHTVILRQGESVGAGYPVQYLALGGE